ncbi:MAG: hypothetical protein M4579_002908 [Chaenotheca gracillima]|nr:MAG: hypothetical protein M4579_002908 [Chaenotheca gracillima]
MTISRVISPSLSQSPPLGRAFRSDREVYDLSHLRTSCAHDIFGGNFWTVLVPQLSQASPAVRYGMLALSALLQQVESPLGITGDAEVERKQERCALERYTKAVSAAKELVATPNVVETDLAAVLSCCIIFVVYENLKGGYKAAGMHLRSGMGILCGGRARRTGAEIESMFDLMGLLDFQALSFSDDDAPYEFGPTNPASIEPAPLPGKFLSLAQARRILFEYMKHMFWVRHMLASGSFSTRDWDIQAERRKASFKHWTALLDHFLDEQRDAMSPRDVHHARLLKMYRTVAGILCVAAFSQTESAVDAHMLDFQQIICDAEEIIAMEAPKMGTDLDTNDKTFYSKRFSFEMGINPNLFVVAVKCRDPTLRRRAVALLRSSSRHEGTWDGPTAASVAEKVIEIEEVAAAEIAERAVEYAGDVPEEKRVVGVYTKAEMDKSRVRLTLIFREPDEDGVGWHWRETKDCAFF